MIEGYTGRVGSGKTYCLVQRIRRYIGKRPIFVNDESHGYGEVFRSWEELIGIAGAIVVVDEMALWASARGWAKMSDEVASYFAQSRKQGVDLLFTAQSFQGVDAIVRRLTAVVHKCDRWGPLIRSREVDGTSGEYLCTQWHRIDRRVYELYDTYAIVGDANGEGGGIGAARLKQAAELALKMLHDRACIVRRGEEGYRRAYLWDLLGDGQVIYHGKVWEGYERGWFLEIRRQGYGEELVRWMAHLEAGLAVPGVKRAEREPAAVERLRRAS